jgi:hypothetical protein
LHSSWTSNEAKRQLGAAINQSINVRTFNGVGRLTQFYQSFLRVNERDSVLPFEGSCPPERENHKDATSDIAHGDAVQLQPRGGPQHAVACRALRGCLPQGCTIDSTFVEAEHSGTSRLYYQASAIGSRPLCSTDAQCIAALLKANLLRTPAHRGNLSLSTLRSTKL